MFRLALSFLLAFVTIAMDGKPRAGIYRGVLLLDQAGKVELPFNFELRYQGKRSVITLMNADERIEVTEIRIKGDSVNFRLPVFDTEIRSIQTREGLEGVWINHYRKNERVIRFRATFGESRRFLHETGQHGNNIEGKWECTFSHGTPNESKAAGIFHHIEQTSNISATFLTETGDYRFLEGTLNGDTLLLSSFDGSRAYLFTALLRNDSLVKGMFYSGMHWQEPWSAKRNSGFALRHADSITTLRDTFSTVAFTYRSSKGKTISLSDKRYRNKPVIVQLLGSWCPNCMDESVYFAELHRRYNKQGLEIIGLAYEKTHNPAVATRQVNRMKERLHLPYEVLITGASGKDEAGKTLPALSNVAAFPTAIFLDRSHRIVKIHTGFSGPATGVEYDKFRTRTEDLIKKLLE